MNEFITQCANYIPYGEYQIISLTNIGQVVIRGDGYYGLIITNNPTSADNTPFQQLHASYATCIPLVLFLTKYQVTDLSEVNLSSLLVNFLSNLGITFDDYYLPNQSLISDLILIWMNSEIDHTDQIYDTSGGTIIYRSEYNWFINPGFQSTIEY